MPPFPPPSSLASKDNQSLLRCMSPTGSQDSQWSAYLTQLCANRATGVRAARPSSGLAWPLRRVTVNLAPSGVRKGGAGLDLPIAIGLLVASGDVDVTSVQDMAFVGELGLDGSLRGVPGIVVLAEALNQYQMVVAAECVGEARMGLRE